MQNTTKEIYMYVLAGFIVGCVFALLYFLVFNAIPQENKDILNIVIGAILGAFVTVISYFFGSSKGSADKNEMLKK